MKFSDFLKESSAINEAGVKKMIVKVLLKKIKSNMPVSIVVDDVDVYDYETKREIPVEFLNMAVDDYRIIGDFETDYGQGLLINVAS